MEASLSPWCENSVEEEAKDGKGSEWTLSSHQQLPPDEGDKDNENFSCVADEGSQRTSRVDLSTVPRLEYMDSSTKRSNGKPEFRQLNAKNLSRMEEVVAAGNMPLRAELLDECPLRQVKVIHGETSASIMSVFTEGPRGLSCPLKRYDIAETSALEANAKAKNSVVAMSLVSEESVMGSPIFSDHLSRRNLDGLSAQFCFGGSILTPEALRGEEMQRFGDMSDVTMGDAAGSIQVEMGSDVQYRRISRSDVTATNDEIQRFAVGDNVSDVSFVPILQDEKMQVTKARSRLRHSSAHSTFVTSGLRGSNSTGITFHHEVSQSMVAEPGTTASQIGDSVSRPDASLSNASVKSYYNGADSPIEEGWEGTNEESYPEGKLEPVPEGRLNSTNLARNVIDVRPLSGADGMNAMQEFELYGEESANLQKRKGDALENASMRKLALADPSSMTLSTEFDLLRQEIGESNMCLTAHLEKRIDTLLDQVNKKMVQVDKVLSCVLEQQKTLREKLDHVYRSGTFSSNEVIAAEKKLRVVVTVPLFDKPWEMLLLISPSATVDMCKQEVLRRIRHQQSFKDNNHHSNFVLLYGSLVLYEEDVLAEIFASELESKNNSVGHLKLTLHTVSSRPPVGSFGTQGRNSATMPSAPSSPCSGSIEPANVPNTEKRTESEEKFVVSTELIDKFNQSESLDRRLVLDMERLDRDAIMKDAKALKMLSIKHLLETIRLTLLDRATYSPVELHRRVARSVLESVNRALAPAATMNEISLATNMALPALQNITPGEGEDDRIAVVQEAISAERKHKEELVQKIEELCDTIATRLRIPANMLQRADSVVQDAKKTLLLASSLTENELNGVVKTLEDYSAAIRSMN